MPEITGVTAFCNYQDYCAAQQMHINHPPAPNVNHPPLPRPIVVVNSSPLALLVEQHHVENMGPVHGNLPSCATQQNSPPEGAQEPEPVAEVEPNMPEPAAIGIGIPNQ